MIHLPDGVGARVTVTSGAGSADIDGETTGGIGAGTVLTTDGFDEGADHYEVTIAGGLGSLDDRPGVTGRLVRSARAPGTSASRTGGSRCAR